MFKRSVLAGLRRSALLLSVAGCSLSTLPLTSFAQNQTINGNLTVTGSIEAAGPIDSGDNTLTFGTQGSGFGGALLHQDNSADTFTFFSNRNPASWLWQHTVGIAAMRLDSNHQLVLYQSNGTTAGVTLAPASNSIKLGTHANGTLTADANGVITAGGGFAVAGGITNANGTLTGGATGLTLNAGGTNQSITLSSSAAGDIIFNTNGVERARINSAGNVGIGTTTPSVKLTIQGDLTNPYLLSVGGTSNGRMRLRHLDGKDYQSDAPDALYVQYGVNFPTILNANSTGNVGIGTVSPQARLHVNNGGVRVEGNTSSIWNDASIYSVDNAPGGRTFAFGSRGGAFSLSDETAAAYRLYINSSGYVGIGTASPTKTLTIAGGILVNPGSGASAIHLRGTGTGFAFNRDADTGAIFNSTAHAYQWQRTENTTSASDNLALQVYGPNGTSVTSSALAVNGLGNVGIGTASPGANTNAIGPIVDTSGAFVSTRTLNQNLPRFIFYDDKFSASYVSYDADAVTRFKSTSGWYWQSVGTGAGIYTTGTTLMALNSNGNLGIGTTNPVQTLDVEGSIKAGGRARVETSRNIGGATGDTVAIGSFTNDGVGKNIRVYLKGHNGLVIDVQTYEINEVAYIGAVTNWLEVPLNQNAVSYTGTPAYALDVFRPNIGSTTDALYLRIRVKRPIGGGTVQLVVEYDDDSTFTALTTAGTTATAFNASTNPAAGAADGYYGAAEWAFPVSNGQGWANAGSLGLFVKNSGNVGIGTTNPTHKLAVNGTIRAKEVIVDTGWADYVFEEDYRLAPLSEVETHIREKKHLPGIPSAAEVAEHGVSMGEMQAKLLSKVEELTLHLIAQEKQMKSLQAIHASEIAALRAELSQLKGQHP